MREHRENPFTIPAPSYATVRPAYPPQAVTHLLNRCAQTRGEPVRTVADIGAGTGKMTRLLAERGLTVVAVEPSAAMRSEFHRLHPDLSAHGILVEGSAEHTGIDSARIDLVVFAQSWHWVDADLAAAEAARILRPRGILSAVWNQMDVSIPWVHRLTRIMRSGDVHRIDRPPSFGARFEEPRSVLVPWEDSMTPEQILELGTTRSSYLRQCESGRKRMQDNLRWYLYTHLRYEAEQPVTIPYSTLVWTAALR
ncbi:class I SAM-dependent methyltransferase [Schaalia sp. ZJ405]|uniref:class I SAM-dependent methyltransferase n=1 Tax=Schaalia sp. ZJ405 TaxID=2709403 RepID=UPI0018CAE61E|nr:class I SAM-dependent methyltransferase [Schaalia sp. ZJ405]QPK81406.1 class I SAM-dependent methyltransferase [Schaalia sp. ZJ405]